MYKLIFDKILEISEDGFLIVDHNGIIIDINDAYCKFLELNQKDIIGKYVLEIIKNSKLPEILKTKAIDKDVIHKLVEGQAPNREKYVFVTRAAVTDENEDIVAAVGQIKFSAKTMKLADKLHTLDAELQYYKKELQRIAGSTYAFDNMIGEDPNFMQVKKMAEKSANNDFSILITGETGTGKEVFANALHYASNRRNKTFIRMNCAAIPSELLESELFGHVEGSFTGAKKGGKKGKFELADGGTIFLDEIGDMPLSMQAKILRVLQEKEIEKVGGEKTIPVDVRVISATNHNLEEKVKNNTFREDLYYRLNVINIKIPALRERPADIKLFIDYFLDELNDKYNSHIQISKEALKTLYKYNWPGNIRELKNAVERSYALVDGDIIHNSHLPANILVRSNLNIPTASGKSLEALLEEIEKEILLNTIKENDYNYKRTAEKLDIHRSTLYKKLDKYHIERSE